MTIQDWKIVSMFAIFSAVTMGISFCTVTAPGLRPERVILEWSTESIRSVEGQIIFYRYFVDGVETSVAVKNIDELNWFKQYLRQVGRLIERKE